MFNYDDNNIFTNYIKQLLSSFNYPNIDIYSDKIIPIANNLYLKDNYIVKYNQDGSLSNIIAYRDNKKIANITKNFENNSLIYDYHTHVWLGNYLRFLRDYKKLDLMSMYNCFTDTQPVSLEIKDSAGKWEFNSQDAHFKIYMMPIKLFETYSIYLDSFSGFELLCGFYDNFQVDNASLTPIYQSYTKVKNVSFRNPFVFDRLSKEKIASSASLSTYYDNRDNLVMFIKIPSNVFTSIVILEGNYSNYNDFIISKSKPTKLIYNTSVNNYEYKEEGMNTLFISSLQLLEMNTGVSHPFADRLIEYLVNNAITPLEEIDDNIKRLQQKLVDRYEEVSNGKHTKLGMKSYGNKFGQWIPEMRNIFYDIAVVNKLTNSKNDILGYCDKDVEATLGKDSDIYSSEGGKDL